MNIQEIMDDRPEVLLNWDESTAVSEIASLLHRIPVLCQHEGRIMEDFSDEVTRYVSHPKLRHFICMACKLVNEKGRQVPPNSRVVSGVFRLGIYPRLRIRKL